MPHTYCYTCGFDVEYHLSEGGSVEFYMFIKCAGNIYLTKKVLTDLVTRCKAMKFKKVRS